MKIEFEILNIDPLGQGVCKSLQSEKVTFIKKTLPEESGVADIFSEKKGVRFARLIELTKVSSHRIKPQCEHYEKCNGCDYQHTTYEKEIEYKKNALKKHLFKFPEIEIGIHKAEKRTNYRNRIQLHYDKSKKLLGLLDEKLQIIPVPNCLIINPRVAFELRSLYENNSWMKLLVKEPSKGHIEIYEKEKSNHEVSGHQVKLSINRNYANGGFTQVNFEMNQILCNFIQKKIEEFIPHKAVIYDLFGGNGNLTAKTRNPVLVVDKYKKAPEAKNFQKFYSIDLYDKNAIRSLINLKSEGVQRPQWLIIDPPRSGLKNLNEFVNEFKPDGIIFIACEATSFARDTAFLVNSTLHNYELKAIELFDLFPSTMHYETVGIFVKK